LESTQKIGSGDDVEAEDALSVGVKFIRIIDIWFGPGREVPINGKITPVHGASGSQQFALRLFCKCFQFIIRWQLDFNLHDHSQ
jgi:hypothetical protein